MTREQRENNVNSQQNECTLPYRRITIPIDDQCLCISYFKLSWRPFYAISSSVDTFLILLPSISLIIPSIASFVQGRETTKQPPSMFPPIFRLAKVSFNHELLPLVRSWSQRTSMDESELAHDVPSVNLSPSELESSENDRRTPSTSFTLCIDIPHASFPLNRYRVP